MMLRILRSSVASPRSRVSALSMPAAASVLLSVLAGSAGAQSVVRGGTDPRFQPWMGCWSTGGTSAASAPGSTEAALASAGDQGPTRACVVPSERVAGSVDVLLFTRDSLISRTPIPAPGVASPREIDDCAGTETAEFVANETRVVLRADLTCARGIKRVETGLMSIAPTGEWMQLQHQQVASNAATTVARLRYDPEATAKMPALRGVPLTSSALRLAVGGTVTTQQVLAVARTIPVALAEAYVAELGLEFRLSGAELAKLADAGMPPRVIDLMVAMANPETFQVGPSRPSMGAAGSDPNAPVITAAMREPTRRSGCRDFDEFCYGVGGRGAWGFGWGYGLGPLGFDPWGYPYAGYGYGFGYPFSRYGFGYGYGGFGWPVYYGNGPVIIVNRPNGGGDSGGGFGGSTRGRAVSGGGYTRASSPSGGSSGTSRTVSPSSGGGSSGSASGGGGSSAGSSGSSGGSARTAKPRGGGGQ